MNQTLILTNLGDYYHCASSVLLSFSAGKNIKKRSQEGQPQDSTQLQQSVVGACGIILRGKTQENAVADIVMESRFYASVTCDLTHTQHH